MKSDPSLKRIATALKQVRNTTGRPHRVSKEAQRAIREAVALVTRDDHSNAELLLRSVLSRWPGGRRQTEAQAMLQRAVDLKHRSKATYALLGELYLQAPMFDRARSALAVGIDLFPDDLELLRMHAEAQARYALELFERIDNPSVVGVEVVLEPLQEALREVMAVRAQILKADASVYRSILTQLSTLDQQLRDAINMARTSSY
jgi:tetratricopeptide (TPR) repeat protein